MHLYLREEPRALLLVTTTDDERLGTPPRALIFRATENQPSSQAVVEFLPKSEVDLNGVVRLTNRSVYGCLGIINVGNDIFLAVVTFASFIGNMRPGSTTPENVSRIQDVNFFSINSSAYDDLSSISEGLASPSFLDGSDVMRDPYSASGTQGTVPGSMYEHPCAPLIKILSSGTFYYATRPQWDLSTRLGLRFHRTGSGMDGYDDRFVWNEYIVKSLLEFRERLDPLEAAELDLCQFIILAIQGYVGVFNMPLPVAPASGPAIGTIALISRLGWKRAGTRFNTRGVDDDGNCANFVETETMFSTNEYTFSYTQVRGSIPRLSLLPFLLGNCHSRNVPTYSILGTTRDTDIQSKDPNYQAQIASQPAFDRHFLHLTEEYSAVHAINLLSTKENEQILSDAYVQHVRAAATAIQSSAPNKVGITNFDFHQSVRVGGHDSVREICRMPGVKEGMEDYSYTTIDHSLNEIVTSQKGVFRTNCLDCLDRTNFVQDILSRTTLELYLFNMRDEWTGYSSLWSNHRELWAENGDALSRIYAGTGALNTSVTRSGKRTLAGVLSDATKSVSRAYINNFQDKSKQTAIDMFLGNLTNQRPVTVFDPVHDYVRSALATRLPEYSMVFHSTIFVGTWNVNGRSASESILPWLFPQSNPQDPDMFVLGFQEIVPLTAQQIVQTDPEKLRRWEAVITETLARRPNKKADYIVLRSEQLVGTALILLVRSELSGIIRNVEAATRKTGLRGMSGNKGAVAIRLQYYDTTFCFVTAHLAAGHANVEERNSDYRTIVTGLHFQKGKTMASHDNVVWLADTNYRIDLDNEQVRSLAELDNLDPLLAADQLKRCMDSQAAFVGYEEGPILFRPTYRYNLHSDFYDTSEKMRIPAWTDRILYRGNDLDLSVYSRAELKGSDHRPVFGLFRAGVRIVDAAKKAALSQELLKGTTLTDLEGKLEAKLQALDIDTQNRDPLPPPSTDEKAWWDGEGHPNGVFPPIVIDSTFSSTNPFDSSPSPSSSSDEELYSHAQSLPTPIDPIIQRKPPPPPL
ncbi:hypothetical protein BS47DRAFT_1376435 [Hydnum rufescens UP504]|uniref:phosphoinositide 5-phosphatase n=1 Tax=Hydnum rufescens UP504 TaxID=1448309 RepID=A0A9P6DXN1_9AGAM|nr:hypothetical protein BS47DRAFT_1376435 [Hydnum rufescens UP504]